MNKITFPGGIHPDLNKESSVDKKIQRILDPACITLPLSQHIGAPNEPLVGVGDSVKVGQCLAKTNAFVSAPVHSPVSGKIKAIEDSVNPVYGNYPAFIIENDGKYEKTPFLKKENPQNLSKEELIEIIKDAGIVGLGGATFPTHVKLSIPKDKNIDTLIINGAECEPYLTCDHRLMMEKTREILKGVRTIAGILDVKNIIIAIEENKLSAIFAMEKGVREINKKPGHKPITVVSLKTKYPQGGEKQLVKAVLKKEIPPGKLPMDVGCLIQNVGTCFAVYEAVYEGKPLIERCVTLTGSALKNAGNFLVKLGTSVRSIVEFCGGFKEAPLKVIAGGPMMGISQYSLDIPVIKGMTGVVFLSEKEAKTIEESTCIRCAKCVDVCPINLMATDIMRMTKYSRWHYLKELNPSDCMECGSCAYVCPSNIPLVQYIKLAKEKERELNKK